MTETAKERIYRGALDEINNLAIDVAMDFEETGIDSVDCGKIMDIANKAFFAETNQQPDTTDKLSVEKLQEENNKLRNEIARLENQTQVDYRLAYEETQEQLNRKVKALTEIRANIEEHNQIYDLSTDTALLLEGIDGIAFDALAAIGGNDEL